MIARGIGDGASISGRGASGSGGSMADLLVLIAVLVLARLLQPARPWKSRD